MTQQKSPMLSVLVPCYNVEKFLDQCLASIVGQTFRDMEIICINDGSTDSTLDIIKKYAAQDDRIKIIDKENEGYGKSMNRGLDMARGKYIGIVESDDWIDSDMYENLVSVAEKYNLDIVKTNFFEYTTYNGEKNEKCNILPEWDCNTPFCPREKASIFFSRPCIWAAIYRRDFLNKNNIRFLESPGASYQDTGFNFKVWLMADRVMLLDAAYLHYRCDNENASVKSKGKVFCITDEWNSVEQYVHEHNIMNADVNRLIAHVKLGGYLWNAERLDGDEQRRFLAQLSKEYKKYIADKVIEKLYFDDKAWNKLLCRIYPDSKIARARKHLFDIITPIYKTRMRCGWKKYYLFGCIPVNKKKVPDIRIQL